MSGAGRQDSAGVDVCGMDRPGHAETAPVTFDIEFKDLWPGNEQSAEQRRIGSVAKKQVCIRCALVRLISFERFAIELR